MSVRMADYIRTLSEEERLALPDELYLPGCIVKRIKMTEEMKLDCCFEIDFEGYVAALMNESAAATLMPPSGERRDSEEVNSN